MAFRFKEQEKTLRAVQAGLHTAQEIYEADDDHLHISVMAINQRLLRLLRAGYVKRKRIHLPIRGAPGFAYTLTAKGRKA